MNQYLRCAKAAAHLFDRLFELYLGHCEVSDEHARRRELLVTNYLALFPRVNVSHDEARGKDLNVYGVCREHRCLRGLTFDICGGWKQAKLAGRRALDVSLLPMKS